MGANGDRHDESERLGFSFWAGLTAIAFACAVGLMIGVALFGLAWRTWGLIGAAIALGGVAAGAMYLSDRRAQKRWS